MNFPVLSAAVFLPVLGAVIIAFLPEGGRRMIKGVALVITGVDLLLTLVLFAAFNLGSPEMQFVEKVAWIPQIGAQYYLGVDGLSMPMVVLTAMLSFLAVLVSWRIELRPKEYFALLLLLEMGVMGVFTALDFLLFFLFWEVELIPMFLLIGVWGTGRKEYSAMKFLLYTMAGSALMLVGILVLYFSSGLGTFDMIALRAASLGPVLEGVVFALLFFAFAVKLPVFPLHTWLPDAHVDAPTAVSVILAGILLKMGGYGMLRITVTSFPESAKFFAPFLVAFALVNVLYGAAVSMVQKDLKKMIAYSSVSHMGYVLLGIAAGVAGLSQIGLTGAALQMFTHGTITGLLFALVGLVYEKTHTRQIPEMGGLAPRMPILAAIFSLAGLASLGLPGLSGFVAEFLVFVGSFPVYQIPTALAALGIVITAGYILWMLQRVFFGPLNPKHALTFDATPMETLPLAIFVVSIVVVGLYPSVLTGMINQAMLPILSRLGAG